MIEQCINLWSAPNAWARCITTNCIIKNNGRAVMGAGIAKQAKMLFPGIDKILAESIRYWTNKGYRAHTDWTLEYPSERLIFFPTKYHFYDKSDIQLIEQSAKQLVGMIPVNELYDWKDHKIYLPRPGCSNGGLEWKDVKKILEPILDDRFVITNWKI